MSSYRRLVDLASPFRGWLLLSFVMSFGVLAAGICLMAMSSYLISRAPLAAGFAALALSVTAVRSLAISRAVLRYGERYFGHMATLRILTGLRSWFFGSIEPLAPARLEKVQSGDLLARITSDIDTLDQFYLRGLVSPVAALFAIALAAGILGIFDLNLGLFLMLMLGIAGILLPAVQGWWSKGAAGRAVRARAALTSATADSVQGMADLMVFGPPDRAQSDSKALGEALLRSQRQMGRTEAGTAAVSSMVAAVTSAAVLLMAIPLVTNGTIDGVYLALLPLTALAAFEAAQVLSSAWRPIEESRAAGERLFELVEERPTRPKPRRAHFRRSGFDVEFHSVSFRYEAGAPLVLDDFNLHVQEGECLLLTGASGCGKSTILNLLLRFWEPQQGYITVGTRNTTADSDEVARSLMAVVPQQVYLFHGTVRDNLLLARGDASDEEIDAACTEAGLDPLLESLPDGLDTIVGENGFQFSGGERQQLALARAFLKDAPILLLDEPTTHLDSALVASVWQSIARLSRGRTTLVISHDTAAAEMLGARIVAIE